MISFRAGSFRFHYRAGAVVLHEEYVLLHRLLGDPFWALPGGRVNAGESDKEAIHREFLEELGVSVSCGELVCTGENFFLYEGEPHHEIGLYFSVQLPASSHLLDKARVHLGVEGDRALEFSWFPIREIRDIDLRPAAIRAPLSEGALPRHFIQRGEGVA